MLCYPFSSEEPPLHKAVLRQDVGAIKKLLQDPNTLHQENAFGFTARELALALRKKTCFELLNIPTHPLENFFSSKLSVRFVPSLYFSDYTSLKQTIRHCPWTLSYGPFYYENVQYLERFASLLGTNHTAPLKLQWINEEWGHGLFSEKDLEKGDYIGEYAGLVRTVDKTNPDTNAYCFHYPSKYWSWKYFVIDAFEYGNLLRFVNHSNEANLEPQILLKKGLLHLIFLCKKPISKGEQLFIDYGPDYWMHRKVIF